MVEQAVGQELTVVTLASPESAEKWHELSSVARVVTFGGASTTGKRFGKLALGLGLDSLAVAAKAAVAPRTTMYLATNPWIALPLKVLTRRKVIVTGLYATPGTRSWRILTKGLHDSPIITLAPVEAENWIAGGGRAVSVVYGNDFPYALTAREPDGVKRIFIGGSSDRDRELVQQLEAEILASNESIELTTAIGEEPRVIERGRARVEHFGRVSQEQFGGLISQSDVSFLPLRPRGRAAGHMILVGSLQVGTPVAFCGASGMEGYADGVFVREISPDEAILPQLLGLLERAPERAATRAFWERNFSRSSYLSRVGRAIELLSKAPKQSTRSA